MIIRVAEPRDVRYIEELFHKLLLFLQSKGMKYYHENQAVVNNGVAGFIIGSLYHDESRVLVAEDDKGIIRGFLIGYITHYPMFFQHQKVGEVRWMYPLSMTDCVNYARRITNAFDIWARAQGCTAGGNYCFIDNERALRAMEHEQRDKVFYYFLKPYPVLEG